jgi:hypothetical protein
MQDPIGLDLLRKLFRALRTRDLPKNRRGGEVRSDRRLSLADMDKHNYIGPLDTLQALAKMFHPLQTKKNDTN